MSSTFNNVQIVGMHFRGAQAKEYAAALQPGDTLTLEREADNQYDQNAIKVMTPGEYSFHLGYVNRHTAAWLAPEMDEGVEFVVTVIEVKMAKNNVYPYVDIAPAEVDA